MQFLVRQFVLVFMFAQLTFSGNAISGGGTPDIVNTHQTDKVCGLKNCHGLGFKCGFMESDPICSMEFAPGDVCRRHAQCQVVDGKCSMKKSRALQKCMKCVTKCQKRKKNLDCNEMCA